MMTIRNIEVSLESQIIADNLSKMMGIDNVDYLLSELLKASLQQAKNTIYEFRARIFFPSSLSDKEG